MDDLMEMVIKDTIISEWLHCIDRAAKYKVIYFPVLAYYTDDDGEELIGSHIVIRKYVTYLETNKINKYAAIALSEYKINNAHLSIYEILKQAISDEKILLFQWLDKKKPFKGGSYGI